MILGASVRLVAELPEAGYYFHPVKALIFLAGMIVWWYASAWVDRDAVRVRSNRAQWTTLIFWTGLLGAAAWVLIPVWFVGLIAFLVIHGTALGVYVVFRNRRVAPAQTVLTPAHLSRLFSPAAPSEEKIHAKDRVRIKGADGKYPAWPTDPVQHEGYQLLQDLLFDSLWRRASEVDLTLAGQQARIAYKVDGVVREREPLPRPQADVVLAQLKSIAGMDPDEIRRPQEGTLTATIGAGGSSDRRVEIVLKSFGSTAGQRLQMTVLAEESRFRIDELGFSKGQLAFVQPMVEQLQGLVICCAPKEGGLTSTLYAMLRQHDAFMRNIHTLETVKRMDLENVTQHVHDSKGGQVPFARALQSIFRTDPDIVMVSDCPDRETAVLCAENAQQKKVYLGMSAGETFEALRRYLQWVGDNELAGRALLCVIAQRLIRKLCTNCRKAYRPDAGLLRKANLPLDQNRPFYRPPNLNELELDKQGNPIVCPVCQGSGYLGRTGIFEVLQVDDEIRGLIQQGAALQAIKAAARKAKMQILQEVGLQRVYEGVTSINEVLRVTQDEKKAAATA